MMHRFGNITHKRDHQGNVRAVIDHTGALLEANDYYPYGEPLATASTASGALQPYKYGGKELLGADADATVAAALAGVYDFGARWHSSLAATFTQPDPKSESYPGISPYAYCAANPIRFTDPTGQKIEFSEVTKEAEQWMQSVTDKLLNNEMFKRVYSAIDSSETAYKISLGEVKLPNGESANGCYNEDTNTITINKDLVGNDSQYKLSLLEELYHVYQSIVPSFDGIVNTEFEAKTFAGAVHGQTENVDEGHASFGLGVARMYYDTYDLLDGKGVSITYEGYYKDNCKDFIGENIKQDVPPEYKTMSLVFPNRLANLLFHH